MNKYRIICQYVYIVFALFSLVSITYIVTTKGIISIINNLHFVTLFLFGLLFVGYLTKK